MSDDLAALKTAIEQQHGGTATYDRGVFVKDDWRGRTAWEGTVHVFELEGHPQATEAYAWSSSIKDSKHRRVYTVLKSATVDGPQAAVREAIVANTRR